MIDVAAVIVENQKGEVLVARRKKDKKLAGYWEFPGGKIEKGENPEESLIRELKEEMNIVIEIGEFVGENIHFYDRGPIRLMAFTGKIVAGEIKLVDHDEYLWIGLDDVKNIRLAPADIPFINMLNDRGHGVSRKS